MKPSIIAVIRKIAKITGIALLAVLLMMFLTPYLFPTLVTEQTKKWANRHLEGELNFSRARLSFFNHFPSLTLTLHDFVLKGSRPFERDTLVSSGEIALGINLRSLFFEKKVDINQVFLTGAFINVQVNENGDANYNVYTSGESKKTTAGEDTATGSLQIEHIEISRGKLVYNDRSLPLVINALGFNYTGNGDLSKDIFDLYTQASIDSMDLYFDHEPYVLHKKINAELVTRINTTSLALLFEKNKLLVNQLPIEFTGRFDFLEKGYYMDFNIVSAQTGLYNLITALPPSYNTWLQKARVEGKVEVKTTLKGLYVVSENKMPTLGFSLKLNDGRIAYDKVPVPVEDLQMKMDLRMPGLDADSMYVQLDTLSFRTGNHYLYARLRSKGIGNPALDIDGMVNADIDLGQLDKSLGIPGIDISGSCRIKAKANGTYRSGKSFHGKGPAAFPAADINIVLNNGSIRTDYYPQPIQAIQLTAGIRNGTGALKDLDVRVTPASFVFEGKPFALDARLRNFEDIVYDIGLKGELDVKKIYRVFSQDGWGVDGFARMDVRAKGRQSDATGGRYAQLDNKGSFYLRDIGIRYEYFNQPFLIKEGLFRFENDKLLFKDFTAAYGSSDFRMNGYLQNVINFALAENGPLKGSFALRSALVNVDEFMAHAGVADSSGSLTADTTDNGGTGVVMIPTDLDLEMDAGADKVLYNNLTLADFKSRLRLQKGKVLLENTAFDMIGCHVAMKSSYEGISPGKALFNYNIQAKDFDVQRAYKEVALFREMVPAAATARGIISLDYTLKGRLNNRMFPVFPSLSGGGVLSVNDVTIKGFRLFNAVSARTGKSDIKDPQLRKVDIKTTIRNNIVTLERVKLKVAGFRPRIEGQTSLDGRLNLKMRLGLPPLGIVGIPIRITGTQDQPVIRLGKQTEDLTETEDTEE